jgi:exopolysaccharide production protein ExoZ
LLRSFQGLKEPCPLKQFCLFFFPYPRADGIVQAIVGQGWTLVYEMFFYAIFACAIFLPRRAAVGMASSALVGVVLAGLVVAPSSVAFAFWSDPIVLEFAFGMLLAIAYREGLRCLR